MPPDEVYKKADRHRREFIEKIWKQGYGHIIDALTRCNDIHSFAALSKCVTHVSGRNVSAAHLKTVLNRLKRGGIKFTIDIRYSMIGLTHVMAFVKNAFIDFDTIPLLDWVRLIAYSYNEPGTLIQYYVPIIYLDEFIEKLNRQLETDPSLIMVFKERERSQPSFGVSNPLDSFYGFSPEKPEQAIDELLNEINNHGRYMYRYRRKERYPARTAPPDLLDLLILKELERDAFIGIRGIAAALPHTHRVVQRHFRFHVKNMIRGVYMKYSYINPVVDYIIQGILYINNQYKNSITTIKNFLKKQNWVLGIAHGNDLNETPVIVFFSFVYKKQVLNLINLFNIMLDKGIIDKFIQYEIYMHKIYKFGIPYSNYDQYNKRWITL